MAAITWLAELFPDKGRKEKVLGWTQAFASVGGLFVTLVNGWILKNASSFPALPVAEPFNSHADWRYTLITGLMPAIPIALLLPFVPESKVWRERKAAGTLKRANFSELFSPSLRRVTLVTAALSACAYGVAFGALQLTPTRIVPGLPSLAAQQQVLRPLQTEASELNLQLDAVRPAFEQAATNVPGLRELAGQRAKLRVAMRAAAKPLSDTNTAPTTRTAIVAKLSALTNQFADLDAKLATLTSDIPSAKKAVIDREKVLAQLGANRSKQEVADTVVKTRGKDIQFWQELGGLGGRIALALMLAVAISRGALLRLFQMPGLIVLPLTYLWLFDQKPELFQWGIFLAGFLTVAQFSYMGEYLPKVFPVHLRATGGSFATNVGGRMIGTSMALGTTLLAGRLGDTTPVFMAKAAAIVGCAMFALGLGLSFLLPEPPAEENRH